MKQASVHCEEEAEPLPAPNRLGKVPDESKERELSPVEQIANLVDCSIANGEITPPTKSEEPQTPPKTVLSPAMLESYQSQDNTFMTLQQ